ncbi:MAG: transcription antitermination factor NusB [Planctomycetales bacterium]
MVARRSKAREVALQMLYQRDLNPEVAAATVREMIADELPDEPSRAFCWQLFVGVMEWRSHLDARIQEVAENWTVSRMPPTDRNVLRLGGYELLFTDTPHRVVIDEAVELAKRYGAAQSSQFVNGILDKLVPPGRRERKGEAEDAAEG